MPLRQDNKHPSKLRAVPLWFLFALVFIVIILFTLAFTSPISQEVRESTVTPTVITTLDEEIATDGALTPEPEAVPRTVEDIGYTDGIIFWSMVLVLIILIATLREIILRKKQ